MEAKALKEMALVDTISSHVFDNNPSAKDIIKNQGFEIVAIDPSSPQQYSNYFVKCNTGHNKGRFVPLEEYAKSQGQEFIKMLVPAELYVNTYFEVENFEKQYWEEYERIFDSFALKLGGGTQKKICYSKEEFERYTKSQSSSANIGGRHGAVNAKGTFEHTSSQNDTKEATQHKEISQQSFQPKCTKAEIQQWIQEENINLTGLPKQLGIIIKEFLDRGCLQYVYEEKEEITQTIQSTQAAITKIQAKINTLPTTLSANIEHTLNQASETIHKQEVYLYLDCKHDGA